MHQILMGQVQPPTGWEIADNAVAFLFSLFTTGVLTYMVWRLMNSFLELFLGRGMAFLGSIFSAVLVLSAGLKVASSFLKGAEKIYILKGLISGIVETISACIAPRNFSPLEFILTVSFVLYLCYWLHTRFVPKHTTDDLKRKLDQALEDESKRPSYPY